MKKNKVIILGMGLAISELLRATHKEFPTIDVEHLSHNQAETELGTTLIRHGLPFTISEIVRPKVYVTEEPIRSKFIDKPKRNFKKR